MPSPSDAMPAAITPATYSLSGSRSLRTGYQSNGSVLNRVANVVVLFE
jgi:hypothetical protein